MNKYLEAFKELKEEEIESGGCQSLCDNCKGMNCPLRVIKELVDKETPMKIVKYKNDYFGCVMFKCPKCNEELLDGDGCYCCECGQKLDWSDE